MKNKSVIIIYIILRITYSFLFTFTTILSLVLTIKQENNLKSIEPKKLSFNSTKQLFSFNQSTLIKCSNNLKININDYLEKFQRKRLENSEIFYNSRQSIQNETIGSISIFHQQLKQISEKERNSFRNSFVKKGKIFIDFYLMKIDQIIDSNWFNQPFYIANNSKGFQRTQDLFRQLNRNVSSDKIRFLEIINISEMLFTIQSIKLLEKKLQFINEIPQQLIKIQKLRIPKLHINRSSSYRYMEQMINHIPKRNKEILTKVSHRETQSNSLYKPKSRMPRVLFNPLSLRIIMMIIDLLLIAHRSYRLFSDVKQFWKGRKSYFQYKCTNQYSTISKKDSLVVDESSFKQLSTKLDPWTKRQNFYCFNSFDVIITVQFVILSVICIGLLTCLASKESSIFMMPLIHSNSHSNSWWFISYKIKAFQLKPQTSITNQWTDNKVSFWKQILLLRQNLTFLYNNNEQNIISQYMWEQCFSERIYPNISLWNQKEFYYKPNMAGYCQMPLPQILINHKSINCDFQKSNFLFYSYYIRRRRFKDRPFFIQIFRLYIIELSYTILSIALIIFSLVGSLKILRKVLRKHCVSESQMIVLLIPQLDDKYQQFSIETSYLTSENNDPGISIDCSKKSYSCYKIDTSV